MAKPRTTAYMALLMTLGLTAGAVMGVGDTQARITGSTAMYNTVLQTLPNELKSDCLVSGGNQVVLLGKIGSGESVSADVTLKTMDPIAYRMTCHTPEGLQVQMDFAPVRGEGSLSEDQMLRMGPDSEAVVTLTITAAEEITRAGAADVQISLGGLSGVFRVELIEDLPDETADPEETEPETEPETEEPAGGSNMEVILPGNMDIPTNMAQVTLQTLREFEMNGLLPVKASVSGLADGVRIGLEGEEPLPAMTRYSLDGGETWYLMYDGGYLELDYENDNGEEEQWHLLLDLSLQELQGDSLLQLEAVACLEGQTAGVCHAETVPREEPERSDTVQILREPSPEELAQLTEDAVPENPEQVEPADPAEPVKLESGAAEGASFRILLPIGWAEATELCYRAELLGVLEDGTTGYSAIEWDAHGLNAVVDPQTGELVVYLGEGSPAAGTYRLTLEGKYEGLCFYREQMTFFINYSTRSDVQNEEVPNNE